MKLLAALLYLGVCCSLALLGVNSALETAYAKTTAVYRQASDQLQSSQYDGLNQEDARIEKHLDYIDSRLDDLSNKVSIMEGVGTGAMGLLAVLQMLSLMAQKGKQ